MLLLEVTQGLSAGRAFELSEEVIRIGRAPSNDVIFEDQHVSGEHARIITSGERVVLQDLRSTNGTTLVRRDQRLRLSPERSSIELETGDLVELGSGDSLTSFRVALTDDGDSPRVVSMKRLEELAPAAAAIECDPSALSAFYAV
jgi:Nif-specific regulatory protein